MTPAPAQAVLGKPIQDQLRAGHPWVYRDALAQAPKVLQGSAVDVVDSQGRFVARGIYDAVSTLAVRIYTLDPKEAIDGPLLARRVAAAAAIRQALLPPEGPEATTAFRLVNGEGDFLPGIVVDLYADVAVLRLDTQALLSWRDQIMAAILQVTPGGRPIRTVYERTARAEGQLLFGPPPPEEVLVYERGMRLFVDVVRGQKTGLFLDQRENRALVRRLAGGRSVWNGFSYTGGFSVAAALGGATQVVSVDSAGPALATARRNYTANGLDPERFTFREADVWHVLRQAIVSGLRYGLVIVDPPSFAPSEKTVGAALKAYRSLFCQAMQIVSPPGLLCASSCSSHVDQGAFLAVLGQAALMAGRRTRVLEVRGQPMDHPTLPLFPEGRYLKFVVLQVD